MYDKLEPNEISRFNLSDMSAALWNYKFFIILFCAFGIFLGGYKSTNTRDLYTSSATFDLIQNSQSSLGDLQTSQLSSLGLNLNISSTKIPKDEVMGREFIISLDQILKFQEDKFFYDFTPNIDSKSWKNYIKNQLGWQNESLDYKEVIWQGITNKFKSNVEMLQTDSGSIQITVTHENAKRSAEIANAIMLRIIGNKKQRLEEAHSEKTLYMSKALADSLFELEVAQSKLENFTLQNNSLAVETFNSLSQRLYLLRQELKNNEDIYNALNKIISLTNAGLTSNADYLSLRKEFPIIGQIEFRKILGYNGNKETWTWPQKANLNKTHLMISKRLERLSVEISSLQSKAAKAGENYKEYLSIERELKLSEAMYKVLIEQVKANSIASGFNTFEVSKIFEYGVAALYPTYPNRLLFPIIGGLIGIFVGIMFSLIFAVLSGVYYSKKSLFSDTKANINLNAKPLKTLLGIPLEKVLSQLSKSSRNILRNLAIEVSRKSNNQILFTSLNTKLTSHYIAKTLSAYMQTENTSIALINFSSNDQKSQTSNKQYNNMFTVVHSSENISILQPNNQVNTIDFIGKPDFYDQLKKLESYFDFIFISANNNDALCLASALNGREVTHISIVKLKRTKSQKLSELRSALPIQGLIYE